MMLKVKVLVIDDEIEFATTLAERLNIRGFETTACFCAEDAMALIHAKDIPDVVLLDLKMPRLDGLETLEEIKNYNPDIEVIMLTGHGGGIPLIGAQKEKHGPFDCIMKPADINELTTKINQAMAKRQTSISRGESE
jgi:DNA-binding NtrC family response regulator